MTRWFRVAPVRAGAQPNEPGHPLYVPAGHQGAGRADNPRYYVALYLARQAQGAVGEAFGDLAEWREGMFWAPAAESFRKLAHIDVPDSLTLLDLDDPHVLVELGLRPTDVVGRNRDRTQEVALQIYLERRWDGLVWWSYWRPEWQIAVVWGEKDIADPFAKLTCGDVEDLHRDHPAVVLAADRLRRVIRQ